MIVESKTEGIKRIDFGRSDFEDEGLIKFKDRFGTSRSRLTYLRYTPQGVDKEAHRLKMLALRRIYSLMPNVISTTVGRLLYRHVG
jgi:lipid II:glycine glycyltransferase (peptidoglycan interpeptide bridge formation enzyme)